MKRIGEAVIVIGALWRARKPSGSGPLPVTGRSFDAGVLIGVIGFSIMTLGGGLLRLSRSRHSYDKSPDR